MACLHAGRHISYRDAWHKFEEADFDFENQVHQREVFHAKHRNTTLVVIRFHRIFHFVAPSSEHDGRVRASRLKSVIF